MSQTFSCGLRIDRGIASSPHTRRHVFVDPLCCVPAGGSIDPSPATSLYGWPRFSVHAPMRRHAARRHDQARHRSAVPQARSKVVLARCACNTRK
jgi:hypothetical protein